MPDAIRSAGFYELPVPIVVADDVLGTVCRTRIGKVPAQVHTPLLTSGDGGPALPPQLPGIPTDHPRIASPWDWIMPFDNHPHRAANCLRRVGVVLEEPAELPMGGSVDRAPRATRLGIAALEGMGDWVERLRTWIEVMTRQDLDHHHPRYDVSYIGAGLWMSNELSPDIALGQLEPINLHGWNSALERIGNLDEPPLEHLLGRDARAAFRRGDLRRAAIDAATATEVALGRLYRDAVTAGHAGAALLPDDRATRNRLDLTSLGNTLLELDVRLAVPPQALDALDHARDNAVQGGRETGADDLHEILATMTTVLAAHGSDPL